MRNIKPTDGALAFTIKTEQQMYNEWFRSLSKMEGIPINKLKEERKRLLFEIVKNELPDRQQKYFYDYFYQGMRVIDIAKKYNISKSTASKQLKHAAITVRRYAKYTDMRLYNIISETDVSPIHFVRRNRKGKLG